MKLQPITVLMLLVLGFRAFELIWRSLHVWYLKLKQKMVILDLTKETKLYHGWWSYGLVADMLTISIFLTVDFCMISTHHKGRFLIFIFPLLFLIIAIIFFRARLRSYVIVGLGKQLNYFDGYLKRLETVYSIQIAKYYCGSYFFYVTKHDGNKIKIPCTLRNAEVVMAFLEMAVAENAITKRH